MVIVSLVNQTFLKTFVNEAMHFVKNGFIYNDKNYHAWLHGLVCKTPVKASAMKVKGHVGYSSCTKCTVEGQYNHRRICFPGEDAIRTDQEFFQQTDEDYHSGVSILTEIPNFGLVDNTPLDYMHVVLLGVMRKLMVLWLDKPSSVKLPSAKVKIVFERSN